MLAHGSSDMHASYVAPVHKKYGPLLSKCQFMKRELSAAPLLHCQPLYCQGVVLALHGEGSLASHKSSRTHAFLRVCKFWDDKTVVCCMQHAPSGTALSQDGAIVHTHRPNPPWTPSSRCSSRWADVDCARSILQHLV